MALTLGTTGMDRDTEADIVAAFKIANAETGHRWTLVEGDDADYVIIDMDSLYGPMSWLRLHGLGRKVIALTAADRQQTDYRLPRPASASDLAVLLSEIATDAPQAPDEAPPPREPQPPAKPEPDPAPIVEPEPQPEPEPPAIPEPEPEPEPTPPAARPLRQWLAGNGLRQRVRVQREGAPALLIDPLAGNWHGPAALKPLAPHFAGDWLESDFEVPAPAEWDAEAATLGPAQPLSRLQWLGGLLSGDAVDGRYLLKKWPQTEREYPKHFRIATAMMKGPASVAEIADASGVAQEDVAGFINAHLASGHAEAVVDAPSAPQEPPPKPAGLFGRMRGR